MVICNRLSSGCGSTLDTPTTRGSCPDGFGCSDDVCPDFTIRRHDTQPDFKVSVEDCNGPLDLEIDVYVCPACEYEFTVPSGFTADYWTCPECEAIVSVPNMIVETNMWAIGKLKTAITNQDTYFRLADDIGFNQVMINDIIIMDRVRLPEHMLVTGFDEINKLIRVQRAYNGTRATSWPRGSTLRIFRVLNSPASFELVKQDTVNVDGSTIRDELTDTYLVHEWEARDTCLPGCYWMEFKLLREAERVILPSNIPLDSVVYGSLAASVIPSWTPSNISEIDFGCTVGEGIKWVRRFPVQNEGFLIKIEKSYTTEF